MTTVAAVVRRKIRRNRQRDAAVRRRVTTVATLRRPRRAFHVLRVIELHVEVFVERRREIFERWIPALRVGVADETHRNRRRRELSAMTIGAGTVTRETRRRGVVFAFVTGVAGKGTVPLAVVQKLRVIDFGTLRRRRQHAKNQRDQAYTDNTDPITHLRFIGFRSAIK